MQTIRRYLEDAANRVEITMMAHKTPVRITGGTVAPRLIRFYVQPMPGVRVSRINALQDDIALALRVPNVAISNSENGIELEFGNPNPRPVMWSTLWSQVCEYPSNAGLLLLGQQPDGIPLLANLASPDVAHILISGTTGSGKSVLMRAMALSLLLSHTPKQLGVITIDLKGRTFPPGTFAAHLVRPIIDRPANVPEALRSVIKLMETRDKHGIHVDHRNARVVIFIDELAELVMAVDSASDITRLLQRGREAGIHIIAATQRPSAAIISGLMKANFPLRLVGRVVSPEDSRIAAGRGGANAERLLGKGDFMAIGTSMIRFQAPLVTEQTFADTIASANLRENEGMTLETAPEPDTTTDDPRVIQDARHLLARCMREGREWSSITEAGEWLCGQGNGGGGNFYRARSAVEYINTHHEWTNHILNPTTTTTKSKPHLQPAAI